MSLIDRGNQAFKFNDDGTSQPANQQESQKCEGSLSDRRILPVFLILLIDQLGITFMIPALPLYAEKLGFGLVMVGIISATYYTCQCFSTPLLGRWSDQFGRKPVLVYSQIGTFISFLMLAFANSTGLVFFARAIDGFTGGNSIVIQAHLVDVIEPKFRPLAFGRQYLAFAVGIIIGPILVGFLGEKDLRVPLYVASGFALVSILATVFLFPASNHQKNNLSSQTLKSAVFSQLWRFLFFYAAVIIAVSGLGLVGIQAGLLPNANAVVKFLGMGLIPSLIMICFFPALIIYGYFGSNSSDAESPEAKKPEGLISALFQAIRNRKVASHLLQFWCYSISFGVQIAGLPLFAERRFITNGVPMGPKGVGFLFAYLGAVMIIMHLFFTKRIVKSLDLQDQTIFGFILCIAGYACLGYVKDPYMFAIPGLLLSAGGQIVRPATLSSVSLNIDKSKQGLVLGFNQSLNSIGYIIGPILGAAVMKFWFHAWAFVPAFICIFGMFLAFLTDRPPTKNVS